jgi:aspartate aminotransferase
MKISESIKQIKPSATLEITKKAISLKAQGKNIISLSIGEPDFHTPEFGQLAAIKSIKDLDDNYPPVVGKNELIEEVIKKFKRDNNLSYTKSEIIISNGAKQALFNLFFVLLNKDDEVLLPVPYWVSYDDMIKIAGGTTVSVKCDKNFKIDLNDLKQKINSKTKILVLNSPNNPSGAVYDHDDLKALSDILLEHPNIFIISDDIYEHIIYDDKKFLNIINVEPKLKERTIIVNGISKCYAMTGWRIGYTAISDPEIMRFFNILQSQSTAGVCSVAQAAAIGALNGNQDFLKERNKIFQSRRDIALDILGDAKNFSCNKPDGAFYLFPSCSNLFGGKTKSGKIIKDDIDFANHLLDDYLVSVVPGTEFGMPGYFRISYALSEDLLKKACRRIKDAYDNIII